MFPARVAPGLPKRHRHRQEKAPGGMDRRRAANHCRGQRGIRCLNPNKLRRKPRRKCISVHPRPAKRVSLTLTKLASLGRRTGSSRCVGTCYQRRSLGSNPASRAVQGGGSDSFGLRVRSAPSAREQRDGLAAGEARGHSPAPGATASSCTSFRARG